MRVAVLVVAVAVAAGGCKKGDALVAVDLAEPDALLRDYVELTPPLRPPVDAEARRVTRIYLKLPKRAKLDADGDGRLRMPDEAVLERVEVLDGKLFDVRGIRFDDDGKQWFHVYRRSNEHLVGWEWPRDDKGAGERARQKLDELVAATEPEGPTHDGWVARYHAFADCASCHTAARGEAKRVGPGPLNATDASGLFTPQALFGDRALVERHRPRDLNIDDRFMRMTCVTASLMIEADREGGRLPRCLDGGVVTAQYDLRGARGAGDKHAEAVCLSRRALAERLPSAARKRWADGLEACRQ